MIYLHDRFYESSSRVRIAKMLEEVVSVEGPVCENVLRKRVAKAWGLSRITDNVNRVFDSCMPTSGTITSHDTGRVFWAPGQDPAAYSDYRIPSDDENSRRTLEEIPPEEIANAMCEVLSELGGCHQDELYREAIKCFGLSALTAKARKFLDIAFTSLQNSGRI